MLPQRYRISNIFGLSVANMGEHQVLLNHPQIDFKKTVYPQIIWTRHCYPTMHCMSRSLLLRPQWDILRPWKLFNTFTYLFCHQIKRDSNRTLKHYWIVENIVRVQKSDSLSDKKMERFSSPDDPSMGPSKRSHYDLKLKVTLRKFLQIIRDFLTGLISREKSKIDFNWKDEIAFNE